MSGQSSPGSPDSLTLGAAVCSVSDMGRAIRFYTSVLGLEVAAELDQPRVTILRAGQGQLWLYGYGGRMPASGLPARIVLFADDVDGLRRRVGAAGARITTEIHDDPMGRMFIFADPDETLVAVRQPSTLVPR